MSVDGKESLRLLGWDSFFEKQSVALNEPAWIPARVVGEQKNLFRLQTAGEVLFWAEISGRFHYKASERQMLPAIGDWVACVPRPGEDRAVIHHLFERRSCLSRKTAGTRLDEQVLASNVDTAFITTSLNSDINLRRLERYLALVWDSGVTPVILLTKADLVENSEASIKRIETIASGAKIYALSTVTLQGLENLSQYLVPTKTVVLLGSSGVGKSTLVNHLMGRDVLRTQEVREEDGKGQHTTTARYLFHLNGGGMLIDTPGMRELQLTDHEDGLSALFGDIELRAKLCRFSDCQHQSEAGCEIKKALKTGELSEDRMQSYLKLLKEIQVQKQKTDKTFPSDSRQQRRKSGKDFRAQQKHKKKHDK